MRFNTFNLSNRLAACVAAAVMGLTSAGAWADCGSCGSDHAHKNGEKHEHATADIVDTAASAGQFNTLVAAVKAAGLVETLKSDGPLTVFAPTDEAFAKLPAGTVESLLLPENKDKLVAVLTYHVVPGKLTAADVVKLSEATTVQGSNIRIKVQDDVVHINDAKVIKADVMASNGVIHVIDTVILPQ